MPTGKERHDGLKDLAHHMREGAKLRNQGFNRLLNSAGASDAFGAANESKSGKATDSVGDNFPFLVSPLGKRSLSKPETQSYLYPHPVTGVTWFLDGIIIDLNDERMWTREQIADWLDTLAEDYK